MGDSVPDAVMVARQTGLDEAEAKLLLAEAGGDMVDALRRHFSVTKRRYAARGQQQTLFTAMRDLYSSPTAKTGEPPPSSTPSPTSSEVDSVQ